MSGKLLKRLLRRATKPQARRNQTHDTVRLDRGAEPCILTDRPKLLALKIAKQFLADNGSVNLSHFTVIDEAAAEAFSRYKGDYLSFSGMTSLSDAAAEALGVVRHAR